jgi:hypothetical protein
MPSTDAITQRTYERLGTAYDWLNRRLFGGTLPPCLITFQRARGARGYFWREAVRARRGKRRTDEIALNPNAFPGRSDKDVMSTLVHEMVHLWQFHFGKPGRRGYHNRQWAAKMEDVGLRPSTTGRPGGARTGESVTHYVISGGPFEAAWGELYRSGFRLEWEAPAPRPTNRPKIKYTCPDCGLTVWGKPGLAGAIICAAGGCRPFVEAGTSSRFHGSRRHAAPP